MSTITRDDERREELENRGHEWFVRDCRAVLARSKNVVVDEGALAAFAASIRPPQFMPQWDEYLSSRVIDRGDGQYITDKRARLFAAFSELAMNCAVNGGYTYRGADGATQKWEIGGSGAAALVAVLRAMADQKAMPSVDTHSYQAAFDALGPVLASVPEDAFRAERQHILAQFAQPFAQDTLRLAFNRASRGADEFNFTYKTIALLGAANDAGFMEDAFYKKRNLVPILFASYAHHEGVNVRMSVPIPADYRVPQTLHNIGVLRMAPALAAKIESGALFHQNDPDVFELRAASVVAMDKIYKLARERLLAADKPFDLQMHHLDGDLWFAGRLFDKPADALDEKKRAIRAVYESFRAQGTNKDKRFSGTSGKAINVYTMRF